MKIRLFRITFKRLYDAWHAPSNAVLVIVGNVQPVKGLSEVRKFFPPLSARKIRGGV